MDVTKHDNLTGPPPVLRVLILEDNPRDAKLTASVLESGGVKVQFEVTDSRDVFRQSLQKSEYDVILADFNLRNWTALDALDLLQGSGKDIPLIVTTGSLGDEPAVECIKRGAADFVLKDRPARLPSAVQRAMNERRLRAENLRASEAIARLATIVESSDDAIIGKTLEGTITSWNKGAEKLYGYSAAEVVGQSIRTLVPPDRLQEVGQILARLKQGERVENYESVRVRKDRALVDVSLSMFLLTDGRGEVTGAASIARDITERKRAETENARLAAIVSSSDDAIFSVTREGLIVTWNAGAERMYGYAAEEIKGKPIDVLIPVDRRGDLAVNREKLYRGEALVHYEFEHLRKDGTKLQVSLTLSPIKDAAGVVTVVSTISRDITDRKRAEEALQNEKAFTESIIDSLPDTFYVIDSRGRYLRWNKNAEKVQGYSSEEVATLDPLANVAEEERPLAARKMQEALARGNATAEVHLLTKDGRKIPYILTATRAVIGDRVYLVGIGVDITERKKAEAEKARLVTAIEQSAEGVVITNTTGEIEYVNPAFTRMTGYSPEEVLGQNPRILKSGKQDPAFYQQLWATILKGEIWHGELINRRKDGKVYTEELNIAPVRSAGGQITHFIATKQDVTERKRLEEQFRQAQKMEAVGRLAGGVAHDFNNLLTIINGYSEMMLDRLNSSDPTRGQLEEIRNAGDRAGTLTRQLLAFSRQQVLTPRVLDLNTLVADVEKMLRRLIGEDIDLAIVRDSALGQVKADSGQIEQILMNLAVNARDAMPVGGKLVIETANVELDEAYTERHVVVPPGRYVLLAVSDTGMGMDAETQAHIFEPFFTTKEKGKGTGLGLATVYGIVKQSSGFIWVYSEPGRGTTFKIYLPRVDEARESVRALEARGGPVPGAETILLVEDEESVRALAARILQDLGYKVLESTSPEDALQTGSRHKEPIDLLLTDVVLPRMSGRKVAEHLTFLRPGLKVLYMSGYTDDAIFRNGVLETGAAFFQKPFTPASLARKVREVLDADREEGS